MPVAHRPAHSTCASPRARRRARSEGAFTLIELIIVVVIVAIIMAIAVPSLRNASRAPNAATATAAGGVVWRAVLAWRMEEGRGQLPTTAALTQSNGSGGFAGGLVDAANRRLVTTWPETGKGAPVRIFAGTGATPPATNAAWAGGIVYAASGQTGWMAAYNDRGALVFRRGVAAGATPVVPVG